MATLRSGSPPGGYAESGHRTNLEADPHGREERSIESKTLASLAAQLADEKKAEDVRVYDVNEYLKVADYFVVVTCRNRTHVRAVYDELHVRLKAAGERHRPVEGADLGWWIVLDYGDVVVHVLQPDARDYYDIDRLYTDCPRLDWKTVDLSGVPGERRAASGS